MLSDLFNDPDGQESLFSLRAEELGVVLNNSSSTTGKQRIILIELQRLFSQLMLLDQYACSTNRLTDSFGWTNNEELQQHDVQELNRILFSAIEQSLVNTKQSSLIQELYRGTCVNKIRCLTCLNVFEREEEFLDLAITVQGSADLRQSLYNSYVLRENLNGNNKYRCEKCSNEYRDAEKYCQLKSLPPILTLSLLRFTYDLRTFQRIKETGKFEFPLELDLKEFLEDSFKLSVPDEYSQYELFSVIIHSGSAYGGHYHTYIKDYDNLGNWSISENQNTNKSSSTSEVSQDNKNQSDYVDGFSKEICLICCDEPDENTKMDSNDLVNLDYLKYETPSELLKAFIYNKHRYEFVKIDKICADLTSITGMSWNKRFKGKYGSIEKFLAKYDDIFELSADKKSTRLKVHDRINIISSNEHTEKEELLKSCLNEVDESNKLSNTPTEPITEEDKQEIEEKCHWYDFDDSKISPIFKSTIKKQFEGNQSAYMLFYRRKYLNQLFENKNGLKYHHEKIPKWLTDEVKTENKSLNSKRIEHENSINKVMIDCYIHTDFYSEQNILNLNQHCEDKQIKLNIDKRNVTLAIIKEALVNQCTDSEADSDHEMQKRKETYLNILFDDMTPSYWLLGIQVNTSSSSGSASRYNFYIKSLLNDSDENLYETINKYNKSNTKSVLILSKNFDKWPIGDQYEPVRIIARFNIKQSLELNEISFTFTKGSPIKQVKESINIFLSNQSVETKPDLLFYLKRSTDSAPVLLDESNFDHKTLENLSIKNGDLFTVESTLITAESESSKRESKLQKINIMNCINLDGTMNMDPFLSGNFLLSNEMNVDISETFYNISILAQSLFEINTGPSSLRYLNPVDEESLIYHGECMYADATLEEFTSKQSKNDKKEYLFLLCPDRAPSKAENEIIIRCNDERTYNTKSFENKIAEDHTEIIIQPHNLTIAELTSKIADALELAPIDPVDTETYYLKTIDWLGDVDSVLNDMNITCSEANLRHNQALLITKGKLIPPNHYKIRVWIHKASENLNLITKDLSDANINNDNDNVQLNDFIEEKFKEFSLIDELIVANSIRLEEFKILVESLLIDKYGNTNNCENFNLRLLKRIQSDDSKNVRFTMKKALIDWHKPLKQLQIVQDTDICVQFVNDENEMNLNQGIILLNAIKIDLNTKLCSKGSFRQIQWNVNNGAGLSSLKESLLKSYDENYLKQSDVFRMHIAKRLIPKYTWILIKDLNDSKTANTEPLNCNNNAQNKKKSKKNNTSNQQQSKSNLRQAPFNLEDGDLIAFAVVEPSENSKQVTAHDFMSTADIEITKKKNITAAELARIGRESQGDKKKRNPRPEVGITIKIDNFSTN